MVSYLPVFPLSNPLCKLIFLTYHLLTSITFHGSLLPWGWNWKLQLSPPSLANLSKSYLIQPFQPWPSPAKINLVLQILYALTPSPSNARNMPGSAPLLISFWIPSPALRRRLSLGFKVWENPISTELPRRLFLPSHSRRKLGQLSKTRVNNSIVLNPSKTHPTRTLMST